MLPWLSIVAIKGHYRKKEEEIDLFERQRGKLAYKRGLTTSRGESWQKGEGEAKKSNRETKAHTTDRKINKNNKIPIDFVKRIKSNMYEEYVQTGYSHIKKE